MAIIYSYPKVTSPLATDVLVLTDTTLTAGKRKNKTKSLALSDLASFVISSTSAITGSGTINTIPMFTPTGVKIGDSIITQAVSGQGVTVTGQLSVTGSTELSNTLTVGGVTTFNADVECNNNVTVQGVFAADGNSVFSGSLTIDEQLIDGTGSSGTAGQVLSSTVTGVEWISDGGGSVTGTGTTNFVSKWLDSDTIQDSIIFDNGTKVGIGTTTPLANLDVKETTTDVAGQIIVGGLIASSTDDTPFGKLCFANTAAANSQPNKILASIEGRKNGSSNRGILTFNVADGSGSNWEKMRIDSYGNVGIGTSGTNPADKLHVQGTVRAVVPGSTGAAFNAINAFGVSSTFRFENNHAVLALKNNSNVVATKISSDGFSWFDGGSVGFGTTTPASPVEMVIPDTSSTSRGGLLLSEAGDSSTLDSVRVEYKSNKSGSGNPGLIFTPRSQPSSGVWETFFRFKTNGGELVGNKANLTVDGRVGIGTTNDNFESRLTVDGGDIEVDDSASGLILRSPDGTRYRVTVANGGALSANAV